MWKKIKLQKINHWVGFKIPLTNYYILLLDYGNNKEIYFTTNYPHTEN